MASKKKITAKKAAQRKTEKLAKLLPQKIYVTTVIYRADYHVSSLQNRIRSEYVERTMRLAKQHGLGWSKAYYEVVISEWHRPKGDRA